jgi:hypothetical protein
VTRVSSNPRIVSLLLGLLALVVTSIVAPRSAWAIEYEVFIDVDSEEELYDLWVTGQISDDTFNTLVELRRRGIDLNQADREQLYSLPNLSYDDVDAILAYRAEAGVIHAPADLAAAGVVSRAKLASILTFVRAFDERRKLAATSGWIRYQTGWSQMDRTVPPMALQARVTTLRQLTIGAAGLLTRQRPGNPVWDPNREALIADPMQPRVQVPKYFVQWDTNEWGIIAGTYRIGFGQRLVFDNSDRYTPNGFFLDDAVFTYPDLGLICRESTGELGASPCSGEAGSTYGTRDFRWRDSLRGVALGAKHLAMPVGWMQLYGFGSWQSRQIYQYDFYDRRRCSDPLSGDDTCNAPDTYVTPEGDRFSPAAEHSFQTLPNVYDEVLGGANITWFHDRRTHVGVTGYGATALWKIEGADLDFRPTAPQPFGGPWGAVGADMAWGRRWSDLTFELARSFDSMASASNPGYGGGGWAALLRHTSTIGKGHELEITGRYYDRDHANPYSGAISQADEYQGNRARDEVGGRVRYGGRIADRIDLRGLADFWVQPSEGAPKLQTYLRADVDVNPWFRPGLWLQYRNIDLRRGVGACVDETSGDDEFGNIVNNDGTIDYRYGCISEVGQITGRLGFRPLKGKLSITAQYQHEFIQELGIDSRIRQDASAFLIVRTNPIKNFRIASRLRYLAVDMSSPRATAMDCVSDGDASTDRHAGCMEESIWAYLDLSYVFAKTFMVRTRYDAFGWLDKRQSTADRIPRIEHRLRLELEVKF